MRIDLHTHILPKTWPDLHARYGYPGWVALDHYAPCCARMTIDAKPFRDITDKRIRRDSFTSVAELELAIDLYVAHHNIDPKPFIPAAVIFRSAASNSPEVFSPNCET